MSSPWGFRSVPTKPYGGKSVGIAILISFDFTMSSSAVCACTTPEAARVAESTSMARRVRDLMKATPRVDGVGRLMEAGADPLTTQDLCLAIAGRACTKPDRGLEAHFDLAHAG